MVCRSTPGNSAVTSYARLASGVDDVQVLSMFHELRAEAPETALTPTQAERDHFLDAQVHQVRSNPALTDRRRDSLLRRLHEARTQPLDRATYYAWQNIGGRAVRARAALDAQFAEIGERYGYSTSQVENAFRQITTENRDLGRRAPRAPEHVDHTTAHIPQDRATRYALAVLHHGGPRVVENSGILSGAVARAEAASQQIADRIAREAAQCDACGQFAGDDHVCPERAAADAAALRDGLVTAINTPSDTPAAEDPLAAWEAELNAAERAEGNTVAVGEAARATLYSPVDNGDGTLTTSDGLVHSDRDGATDHDHNRADIDDSHQAREANPQRRLGYAPALLSAEEAGQRVTNPRPGAHISASGQRFVTREAAIADTISWDSRQPRPDGDQWITSDGYLHSTEHNALQHDNLRRSTMQVYGIMEDRCTLCGQFRAAEGAHICPPAGAPETDHSQIEARENAARQDEGPTEQPGPVGPGGLDWSNPTITTQPVGDPPAAPGGGATATATLTRPAPTQQRTPLRTYTGEDGSTVRMMNLSQVTNDLRDAGTGNTVTVENVEVRIAGQMQDTLGRDVSGCVATVTGSVAVLNTGQRRTRGRDRFTVSGDGAADPTGAIPLPARTLQCTCPQYRTTYDCPHLHEATERVQALLNHRDPVATAPLAAVAGVEADLAGEYDASLAAQQAARAGFAATSDQVSYAADMSAFQSAWDEAKARIESGDTTLPYMTGENVTGGLGARDGGRSFGIEIEVDFPDDMSYTAKTRVAREIYEAGLSDSPEVRPWHWRARQVGPRGQNYGGGYTDDPNMWSVEFDSSVDDVGGNRGCEIVSPIMYDEPHTWENIAKICEIVQRNGGRATPRTGLHVNVGARDYDHTVENHNRLLRLGSAYEDVIVRAAHNPQAGRTHRGREYCRPVSVPASGYTTIREAQRSVDPRSHNGSSHRAMINLDHVPAEGAQVTNSTRVEVRIFDGTVDPGRMQTDIKVALGLVNAATRGEDVPETPERAGTHRAANMGANGRMRRLSGEAWTNDTASFRRFADTIFSRAEDKQQLVHAFASSRWQAR